jgi:predicted CXXCH cytochrome family protein
MIARPPKTMNPILPILLPGFCGNPRLWLPDALIKGENPMLSISRKLLFAMIVLAWVLSGCTGIPDQVATGLGTGVQMMDFLLEYPTSLDAKVAVTGAGSEAQSGCFEGGCHASLIDSQEQFVHTAFAQNRCLACHTADHTDPEFTPERTLELCNSCHSTDSFGNSHIVGVGIIDPRNGEMLTCLSCHGHHSGKYSAMLTMDGRGTLCVSCHTNFVSPSAQPQTTFETVAQ